jgi:4-hydroxy-tetrahydrodipicolinate synthase
MSITACFVPDKILLLYNALVNKDIKTAKRIYNEILPLLLHVGSGVNGEPNPAPFKAALELVGRPAGPTRLPVMPVTSATSSRIKGVLKDAGLIE